MSTKDVFARLICTKKFNKTFLQYNFLQVFQFSALFRWKIGHTPDIIGKKKKKYTEKNKGRKL